jgi:hypothetical protein
LRTTTCGGFSDAFLYLLEPLGIEVLFVTGTVVFWCWREDSYNAWNLLRLDGRWFHVDVTWSQSWHELPNDTWQHIISYDWFLTSDTTARNVCAGSTRYWDTGFFPAAPADFSWRRPILIFDQTTGRWRHVAPAYDRIFFEPVITNHLVDLSINYIQAGTLSISPGSYVAPQTQMTLSAQANSGFEFSHWEVWSGAAILQNAFSATTTFSMPDHNVTIRAVFRQVQAPAAPPAAPVISIDNNGVLRWYSPGTVSGDMIVYGIFVDGVHQTGIGNNANFLSQMSYDLTGTMTARGFQAGIYQVSIRALSHYDLSPVSVFSNTVSFEFQPRG